MREGIQITPEVKEYIWTAHASLASAPIEERTITGLAVLLQSNDLKQALRTFCVGGACGRLLDVETERGVDFETMEAQGYLKVVCLYPEAQNLPDQSPDDPTIG